MEGRLGGAVEDSGGVKHGRLERVSSLEAIAYPFDDGRISFSPFASRPFFLAPRVSRRDSGRALRNWEIREKMKSREKQVVRVGKSHLGSDSVSALLVLDGSSYREALPMILDWLKTKFAFDWSQAFDVNGVIHEHAVTIRDKSWHIELTVWPPGKKQECEILIIGHSGARQVVEDLARLISDSQRRKD